MRCEIVAIGTELLLGQIVDTNSSWLGSELAMAGIDSHLQIKVGDNLDRMVDVLRGSLERSDVVICCGGLGPTQDDITREALARVLGVELIFDEDRADIIRWMFRDVTGPCRPTTCCRRIDRRAPPFSRPNRARRPACAARPAAAS